MSAFLLDTNVFRELSKKPPDVGVRRGFERHFGGSVTASVVIHEVRFGVERLPLSRRRTDLERFYLDILDGIPVLPYDQRAALWHAVERVRLAASGIMPPFQDAQIAAIAAVNDATLVTDNVADYKAFRDLRIENWKK